MSNMNCPSAFFTDEPEETMPVSSAPEDLRLLASSEVGYSELWRCREEGKFLILKALKPQYRNVPVYEDLLRKEFSLGYELEHPNICRTYGYKHYPELGHCIIMQWIDGEPLRSMLPISDKKLSRKIVSQLCGVLEYIHSKQVIHKDLKPDNILITHNGQNVKLIDFGLSDSDDYALLKFHAGTQAYAAPELLSGGKIDCRTDVYSFGKVLQELPGNYARVAARCTKDNPDDRYSDMAEVRRALERRTTLWLSLVVFAVLALAVSVIIYSCADYNYKSRTFNDATDRIVRLL